MDKKALSRYIFLLICIAGFAMLALTFHFLAPSVRNTSKTHHERMTHGERTEKEILVLLSAHATNVRTAKWIAVIENWAAHHPYFNINLNIVELDVLRSPDAAEWQKKIDKELPAIGDHHYDMILTLDNVALDLLIRPENHLPADIPVLFSGYEKKLDGLLQIHPNMTGVQADLNIIPNIELGRKLFPQTKEIIVLVDASSDSQVLLETAKNNLHLPEGVKISSLSNKEKSIMDIYNVLRKKQDHTFLVFPPWREMAKIDYQTRIAMAQDLARIIKFPFFISTDEILTSGALGGYLVPVTDLAEKTTEMASILLKNKTAQNTPPVTFANRYLFDYTTMHEFGLRKKDLPAESLVVNIPPGIWQTYHREIILIFILILLLFCGLGGYTWVVRRTLLRSRKLYSALPGRIVVINEREEILYLNVENEMGEDFSTAKVLRDIPNMDYPKISGAIRDVFRTGKGKTLDYEYKSVKRTMSLAPLTADLFGQKSVVWFSHDNSELQMARQQAEDYAAKLKKTTRLWDVLINSLPIHIFAKDADHDFRYIFNNQSRADFFGFSVDALNGKNDFDFLPRETAEKIRQSDEKNMRDLKNYETDFAEIHDASGNPHIMKILQIPFVNDDGSRILLGTAIDTTELVKSRHVAEENAGWFKRTLQSIGDGVITTDANGNIVLINPVAERMIGVKQADVIGHPHDEIFKIVSAYGDLPMQSPLLRTLRTGCIVELANHTDLIAQDGNRYHIADSAAPILDYEKNIIGAILVFRDVTEEYDNRDQLRDMLKMLEYGADLTNSAPFSLNLKTGTVTGSKKIGELWPIRDNGRIASIRSWVYEPDRQKMKNAIKDLKAGKRDDVIVDYRAVKNNQIHYYQAKISAERSMSNGTSLIGVVQDITEITTNMQKRKESTELWETVISTLPIMFFVKDGDNDFRYLMCNEAFAKFHNYSIKQIIGKNDTELLRICPKDILADDLQVLSSHEVRQFYYTVEDANGFLHKLESVKKCFVKSDGRRIVIGALTDITALQNIIQNETAIRDALSNIMLEPTFKGAFERLASSISDILKCDRIILAKCNSNGQLRFDNEWHLPRLIDMDAKLLERHHKAWDAHIGLLHNGELVIFNDFRT